jgi:circadian clock protein KaiC
VKVANQDPQQAPALPRIRTGVPGFDEITGGGFLKSGVYILQGVPGAGKTILANQIVHTHAAAGGQVVYVTMLAESHARLLQHMGAFTFFDYAAVPDKVYYVSAFNALRAHGLKGVVDVLRNEMRTHGAGILVLDGLVMAASAAASDEELKLFVSDLQAHSTLTGCTTLLLTSDDADRPVSAEQTMVDGILLLRERAFGPRRERNIEVLKFRGSETLRGNHSFEIGPQGIVVYPRLEAAHRDSSAGAVDPVGVSTGVEGIDRMFAIGGYARGSVTALSGQSGAGKTTLALHFLARCHAGEKGLCFNFYESPDLLREIARLQGIDPGGVLASAAVDFMWAPFGENILDRLAAQLLERVAATGARRVVIDGVGGFMASPAYPERGGIFFATLMNELRRLGATTLVIVEEREGVGERKLDTPTMSALADTIMELRVTRRDSVRRFVSVGKSRVTRTDLRVRELVLGPSGLAVLEEGPPLAP